MNSETETRPGTGAPRGASLLVVGAEHLAVGAESASVLHCASGAAALRAAGDPAIALRLEAVCAATQLVDMTGTGLLDRLATVLPAAVRVLLVPADEGGEEAAAPPSALVTDVWTLPADAPSLRARFDAERRSLLRMHALQTQLDELHGALDVLRARYLEARRARDLLVDSVGTARGDRSRWWQDYRQLTALRETGCPVHRRAVPAARLEGELLRVGVDLTPGALGRDFAVRADPALLREILERLRAGLARHGLRGARPQVSCRTEPEVVCLELTAPLQRPCDAAELLDPLAVLDGGPVEGAPLDLPLAEALAEAHDSALRVSVTGGELRARLRLPRADGPRRCREPGPQVVRALDRTL